jgi:NADH-quinone oxidoreductase subunit L
VTLLVAGMIALVQTDIKRVIAYSTMSQIGYMFVGAAGGTYAAGMFHLMTHAFFKALLFLAAGLVIHAVTGEQDIRKLAGIGRLMPHTRRVFLIGCLALVGVPPFAGFFSKDEIVAETLGRGGAFGDLMAVGLLIGAFLTGLYTFRLFFIVFTGEPSEHAREHFHAHGGNEGRFSMVWPVTVLGGLSVAGGFLQFAPVWHPLSDWLNPIARPFVEATTRQEIVASIAAVVFGLAGILVAWSLYRAKTVQVPQALRSLAFIPEHKFYFDKIYDLVFYKAAVALSWTLQRLIERPLIAGTIGQVTGSFGFGSRELGRVQNGLVRSYALALASGLAILAVVFLSTR